MRPRGITVHGRAAPSSTVGPPRCGKPRGCRGEGPRTRAAPPFWRGAAAAQTPGHGRGSRSDGPAKKASARVSPPPFWRAAPPHGRLRQRRAAWVSAGWVLLSWRGRRGGRRRPPRALRPEPSPPPTARRFRSAAGIANARAAAGTECTEKPRRCAAEGQGQAGKRGQTERRLEEGPQQEPPVLALLKLEHGEEHKRPAAHPAQLLEGLALTLAWHWRGTASTTWRNTNLPLLLKRSGDERCVA